jgi:hypothetical protein
MNSKPPRWADHFLKWYCHPDAIEDIQGDLHELFYHRLFEEGQWSANLKFIFEVFGFCRWSNFRNPLARMRIRDLITFERFHPLNFIPAEHIVTMHWNEMVFESRNKKYGAYHARMSYTRNLLFGLVFSVVLCSSLMFWLHAQP